MQESLISFLRCPVTRSSLHLQVISNVIRMLGGKEVSTIREGILYAEHDWFYPIIDGIPRLIVEATLEYSGFFMKNMPEYERLKQNLEQKYSGLIRQIVKKNKRTRQSFSLEWEFYDYEKDKTWNADGSAMVQRFLKEIDEEADQLNGKLILDAGCGNGLLDQLVSKLGATIVAMDFSNSIVRANDQNQQENVHFIQGDIQFPPLAFQQFDIVQCSGVLIHTSNSELSFSSIEPCVRKQGKISVWLYHPRRDLIHNLFNFIRRFTSRLPIRIQYYLYLLTIFPLSYLVKRAKGNKQNRREMMIDILDWFSPQYRWEHRHDEAAAWFYKRNYDAVKITTNEKFGFNITGVKN